MERHILKSIKDNVASLRDNSSSSSSKVEGYSWDHNYICSGGDYLSGFSWPPRSYTCSFCKREFRSAQALGGHMNVHRRDRARLRQSPPWDGQGPELNLNLNPNPYPNPNPNPNPNSTSSSHASRLPPFTYRLPSLLSPTLNCFSSMTPTASCVEVKTTMESLHDTSSSLRGGTRKDAKKTFFGEEDLKGFIENEDEYEVVNTEDIVKLDLEIGLCRDSKEDLDLELRLGYS